MIHCAACGSDSPPGARFCVYTPKLRYAREQIALAQRELAAEAAAP